MTQTPTATSTSTDFGTIGWARQRGGRMTRSEKLRELMTAGRVLLPALPAQIHMRLGARNRRRRAFKRVISIGPGEYRDWFRSASL